MKKLLSVVLCLLMIAALLPSDLHTASAEEFSGQCGDDLYWSFDESTGTLTITGSGEMWPFESFNDVPWRSFECMTQVEFPDGLLNISDYSFDYMFCLQSVEIPDTVTRIGDYAFPECTSLQSLTLGKNVESIGKFAFDGCESLTEVVFPNTLKSIGWGAFEVCKNLQSITIPDGVTEIKPWTFNYCIEMKTVTIPNSVTSIGEHAFCCDDSITDVYFNGTEAQKEQIGIGEDNDPLLNATWHYSESPCPHAHTHGDGTSSTVYTEIEDDLWHKTETYWEWVFFCDDCGEQLPDEEYVTTVMEQHSYDSDTKDVCSQCGHHNQCRHLHFETRIDIYRESATYTDIGDNREHQVNGYWEWGEYCLDCGCWYLSELRQGTINELHDYDASGVCLQCGHRNTCTHPDGHAIKSEILNPQYYDHDDSGHWKCGALQTVEYCPTCQQIFASETEDYAEREEGHEYDPYGYCHMCGHKNDVVTLDGVVEWNAEDVSYKGSTPYVIANGSAQEPRFTVKNSADGSVIDPANYDYEYKENTDAGTAYVIVTFKNGYAGACRGWFKIYLPPTTTTTVENVGNGIKLTWSPVEGAVGYVIYRRAWSSTTNGWTEFKRWNNTTGTTYIDGTDDSHKVYAGTRYQYGVKAYFARRVDPVTGATIGGNVGDNYNLGEVGPLKTTVRITTRVLNSVTAARRRITVNWTPSKNFTGYQVQCAENSAFTKNVKTVKISDPKTAQTVIRDLNSGRTYYVRVRSYHEFNGMTYFGEWSNVLTCKVK